MPNPFLSHFLAIFTRCKNIFMYARLNNGIVSKVSLPNNINSVFFTEEGNSRLCYYNYC